jgi:hypothetical protein
MLLVLSAYAQRHCASLEHWGYVSKKHASGAYNRAHIERHTQQFLQGAEIRDGKNIVIPVVVNVIYHTATENISDAQILEQIRVLNEDFGRLNPDADATWPQATATGIQFQLANLAPDGTPTSGIRRKYTSYSIFSTYDDVKFDKTGGLDAWPTQQYLNLWVCNLEGDIMGYGQFPGGPPATDGVVIDYLFFGRFGHTLAPYDRGRTTTHEVGHWLNLFHIWGDGDCTIDDMVPDTPDSDDANHGCPKDAFSCGGKLMVQNFMDYTDDACMNLFTQGQARRMQALFAAGGFRQALLQSPGLLPLAQTISLPTCTDGKQNGDETGIDCGGSCAPCAQKVSCPAPPSIKQVHSGTKVTLYWDAVGSASYLAEIRQLKPSISKWAAVMTPNNSASVSGVRIGRTYEWRVRCICQTGDTSAAASSIFITRSNERSTPRDLPAIYPNPAQDQFFFNPAAVAAIDEPLRLESEEETALSRTNSRLLIKNMQGQVLKTQVISDAFTLAIPVPVSDLALGMYFVHWVDQSGKSLGQVQKLVVH